VRLHEINIKLSFARRCDLEVSFSKGHTVVKLHVSVSNGFTYLLILGIERKECNKVEV